VILPIVAYTRLSSPYNEFQGVSIWHAVDLSSMTSFVISSSVTLFAKYPEREAEKKKQGIKNLTDLQAGIEIHAPHHSFIWLCSALPPTLQSSPSLLEGIQFSFKFMLICGYEIPCPPAHLRGFINDPCPCSIKRETTNSWDVV